MLEPSGTLPEKKAALPAAVLPSPSLAGLPFAPAAVSTLASQSRRASAPVLLYDRWRGNGKSQNTQGPLTRGARESESMALSACRVCKVKLRFLSDPKKG